MGMRRTVFLAYSDGTEEDLVADSDSQKLHDLLNFCSGRLSELINKTVTAPANCFVNFYDSATAIVDTHRDMANVGSTVMVLVAKCTSSLESSLEAPTAKEMDWKKVDLEQGDIPALGPNVTHRFTGSPNKRAALVCFF
jgi:hypothetical protein